MLYHKQKNPVDLKRSETLSSCRVIYSDETKTSEGKVILNLGKWLRQMKTENFYSFRSFRLLERFPMKNGNS